MRGRSHELLDAANEPNRVLRQRVELLDLANRGLPAGELFVVSDRTGWWNLYRVSGAELRPVCPMEAEFGEPQWVFGQAMYGFAHAEEIVATCIVQGMSRLGRIYLSAPTSVRPPARRRSSFPA